MSMNTIDIHNEQVVALFKKYHVKTLRMFGSVARGDSHPDSDIDLLVTFSQPVSLLQMVSFERELSFLVGKKIDLVTPKSISKYLKSRILAEAKPIYAAA